MRFYTILIILMICSCSKLEKIPRSNNSHIDYNYSFAGNFLEQHGKINLQHSSNHYITNLCYLVSKVHCYIVISASKSPTAFLYGKNGVIITAGLLNLMNNEDELAFVIAHELAHSTLNHINIVQNASTSANKRQELELEADNRAIDVILNKGYSPYPALNLLTKLNNINNSNNLEGLINDKIKSNNYPNIRARLNNLRWNIIDKFRHRRLNKKAVKNRYFTALKYDLAQKISN